MLVLSRKLNERIVIGGSIVLTVVKIQGGNVRLGIEAPCGRRCRPPRAAEGQTASSGEVHPT